MIVERVELSQLEIIGPHWLKLFLPPRFVIQLEWACVHHILEVHVLLNHDLLIRLFVMTAIIRSRSVLADESHIGLIELAVDLIG